MPRCAGTTGCPGVEAPARGAPSILGRSGNGLVALIAEDTHTLLALERSYSIEMGVAAKIFQLSTRNASNIVSLFGLLQPSKGPVADSVTPIRKKKILNIGKLVPKLDNLEGMTFGPVLPDGRRSLILVSDNNFKTYQKTQLLAFAVSVPGDSGWTQPEK